MSDTTTLPTLERELAEVRGALADLNEEASIVASQRDAYADEVGLLRAQRNKQGCCHAPACVGPDGDHDSACPANANTLRTQRDSALKERDELRGEVERMRGVYDAAKHLRTPEIRLAFKSDLRRMIAEDRLREATDAAIAAEVAIDDPMRCAVCGWSISETTEQGCVPGNCCFRPRPERLYAPERAMREQETLPKKAPGR